jgi:thymidylate synthase (FAD)
MNVDYIDHMGTDLTVVNAARVSLAKHHEVMDESDVRLIKHLATHDHWSPFSHCQVQFRITAPLFVARQLWRSHVGLSGGDCGYMGWNEVSRRYVDEEPEFYVPDEWRGRPPGSIKQGSGDEVIVDKVAIKGFGHKLTPHEWYDLAIDNMASIYNGLIGVGIAPEMARMVLPASVETSWYWTGSLAAWGRICKLRLDQHAQKESRVIAERIAEECRRLFPVSWEALINGRRN